MPYLDPERAQYLINIMMKRQKDWDYMNLGDDLDVIAFMDINKLHCFLYEHKYPNGVSALFFTAYEGRKPYKHHVRQWLESEIRKNSPDGKN